MKVLLDTHCLAWWVLDDPRLSQPARAAIADPSNDILVSAISAFEMATKHRLGKWPDIGAFVNEFEAAVSEEGFRIIEVNSRHAVLAGLLTGTPRDPFVRLIAAQAIVERVPIVSGDVAMVQLGAEAVW